MKRAIIIAALLACSARAQDAGVWWGALAADGAATSFAPTDISGCVSWWDATDNSYFLDASSNSVAYGDAVTYIKNRIGNVIDAQQTTLIAWRPVLSLSQINGKAALVFDGDARVVGTNYSGTPQQTIFVLAKRGVDASFGFVGLRSDSAAYYGLAANEGGGSTFGSGTVGYRVNGASVVDTTRTGLWSSLSNRVSVLTCTSVDLKTWVGFTGVVFALNSLIGERIVYSRNLTLEEIIAVETYLTNKWGIVP